MPHTVRPLLCAFPRLTRLPGGTAAAWAGHRLAPLPRLLAPALAGLSLLLLAACGGGGSDASQSPPITASARGVYGGTLTNAAPGNSAFQMVVFGNGDFWAMYGRDLGGVFGVTGFLQGQGSASEGRFTAANTRDFGQVPALNGNTVARYDPLNRTINGSVAFAAGTVGFSGGPIAGSAYNLDAPANLASLAGNWSLTSLQNEGVALTVQSSGSFTGRSSLGCLFTGTLVPRTGENAFDVSMRFGPAPCALPGQTATGAAFNYPIAGGRSQLLVAAVDATRTAGVAVFGVR